MRDQAVSAVDAGLRRKLEMAEQRVDALNKEKAVLTSQVNALEKKKDAAQIVAREATESRQENTTALEEANHQLNTMQVDLAQARSQWEEANPVPNALCGESTNLNIKSVSGLLNLRKRSAMQKAVQNCKRCLRNSR